MSQTWRYWSDRSKHGSAAHQSSVSRRICRTVPPVVNSATCRLSWAALDSVRRRRPTDNSLNEMMWQAECQREATLWGVTGPECYTAVMSYDVMSPLRQAFTLWSLVWSRWEKLEAQQNFTCQAKVCTCQRDDRVSPADVSAAIVTCSALSFHRAWVRKGSSGWVLWSCTSTDMINRCPQLDTVTYLNSVLHIFPEVKFLLLHRH